MPMRFGATAGRHGALEQFTEVLGATILPTVTHAFFGVNRRDPPCSDAVGDRQQGVPECPLLDPDVEPRP